MGAVNRRALSSMPALKRYSANRADIPQNARKMAESVLRKDPYRRLSSPVLPGWFDPDKRCQGMLLSATVDLSILPGEPVFFLSKGSSRSDMAGMLIMFSLASDCTRAHFVSPGGYLTALKSTGFDHTVFRKLHERAAVLYDQIRRMESGQSRAFTMREKNGVEALISSLKSLSKEQWLIKVLSCMTQIPEFHILCLFGFMGIEFYTGDIRIDLQYSVFSKANAKKVVYDINLKTVIDILSDIKRQGLELEVWRELVSDDLA